jgi:formylglycine-generating enzyme required for sulfatase activity
VPWPAHEVTIAKPFYMGKYEVTQEQFEKVMGYNPSNTIGPKNPVDGGAKGAKGDKSLSWPQVELFCKKVSELTGKTVRLPTEGEWEYAAKAGENPTITNNSKEAMAKVLDEIAWWEGNSEGHTHPVGTKRPNAWGVYDMIGNIYEMTQSWQMAYSPNPVVDPQGAAVVLTDKQKEQARGHKMVRGEYYAHGPSGPHKWAYRFGKPEQFSRGDIGFRIVVEAPTAP